MVERAVPDRPLPYAQSRSLPCPDCGAPVEPNEAASHVCENERLLAFQNSRLRQEIAQTQGPRRLRDWGLLDRVAAPPCTCPAGLVAK